MFDEELPVNLTPPPLIPNNIQQVLNFVLFRQSVDWGSVMGGSACNPICDAQKAPANNGRPNVPKPPDPILRYDQCATQVRNQARKESTTIEILSGVGLGNAVLGCAGTGPLIGQCEAGVGAVELLVTLVNWGAEKNSIWEGEAACMQGH
jgi:hypothetical protein